MTDTERKPLVSAPEGPWVVPAGCASVVCEGNDPAKPGRILFVLRHPVGTSDHIPWDELEACARLAASAPEMLAVLNAVRINMKNQDRRPGEEKIYKAVCYVVAQAEGTLSQ